MSHKKQPAKSLGKMAPSHRAEPALTHIKDLVPDPANRRKHNPRNIGMVVDALHAVGAARSIVIDEHNVILAGNGVTEAAGEAGITKLRIIDAAGDELIAVRRTGLSDEQKRALAIFDNRTGELAEWDLEQLRIDQESGLDFKPFFFDDELKTLLGASSQAGDGNGDDGATTDDLGSQFLVLITCVTEQDQVQLLERFTAEGLACKALVS